MAAPVVTSVTPSSGAPAGDTFVKIVGTGFYTQAAQPGSVVVVKFGGVEALEVGVVSSTLVLAVVPPSAHGVEPGAVAVVVENYLTAEALAEPGTLASGFTYRRPSIATPTNFSNHSIVALVTRQVVADLQRCVLQNTSHDAHPEYADVESALVPQEAQAELPSLKVVGPTLSRDPDYGGNEREAQVLSGSTFASYATPVPHRLAYEVVGAAKTSSEATNLWREVVRYFRSTPDLKLTIPVTGELVEYEQAVDWDRAGEFRAQVSRQGVYQFALGFAVRGVQVLGEKIGEGYELTEDVELEVEEGVDGA